MPGFGELLKHILQAANEHRNCFVVFGQLKRNVEWCFIVSKNIALCSWGSGDAVSPQWVHGGEAPGGS